VRAIVFVGLALLGLWHLARLQTPSLGVGELVLPLAFALALAGLGTRSPRALAVGAALWVVGAAAIVGERAPSRARPFATFTVAFDRLREGGSRFASVFLPFDPTAEPGVHGLLVAGAALWLAALALVWLVWRRPLATVIVGVLPVAISSSEFPLPRPGLRVALFVAFALAALANGRRVGAPAVAALGAPLVLVALVAGSVPGVARAGLVDWRAWGGSSGGTGSAAASDVRYAWDQSYDGLHYTGDPTVVLHIRSPRPSYWRVTVLDSFDGLRFSERVPAARTAPAGAVARVEPTPRGTTTQLQVQIDALDEPYLVGAGVPTSYAVPESTGGGTVDANGVVRVLRPPPRGTRYDVSAVIAEPTANELRTRTGAPSDPAVDEADAVPFSGDSALPAFGVAGRETAVQAALAGRPAWQRAYAWAVRRTAGARTPYDVALRLELGLRATHGYDEASTLPPDDPDALASWVVDGKPGYCQMFSASMAELLRLLGVPARIVEGFDTGVYDPSSKSYVIDDRDAHAWVEAWLPGSGFVPFDPTPGHTLPNQAALVRAKPAVHTAKPATTPPSRARASAPSRSHRSVVARTGAALDRPPVIVLAAVLALLVLAASAVVLRRVPRRRTKGDPRAAAAEARSLLRTLARRRGIELSEVATNGDLAGSLMTELGLAAGAWAAAADRVAYAPLADAVTALPALHAETRLLADEIRARGRVTIPV
jgi:protein-glutamine gamma-glutamyltransferase